MANTSEGGRVSAKKIGSASLAERGRKGGAVKVKKGFAVSGLASKAGQIGGKSRARKYQDPNFDKEDYLARRAAGMRGQGEKPNNIINAYSPSEWQRRKKLEKDSGNEKTPKDNSPETTTNGSRASEN